MEPKKNPKVAVAPKKPMFKAIGLCLSLSFVLVAFEWKTDISPIIDLQERIDPFESVIDMPLTAVPPPEPPKPKVEPIFKESEELIEEPEVDNSIFEDDWSDPIPEVVMVEEPPEEVVPEFRDFAEEMPSPVGGMQAFYKYMGKNMDYPRSAIRMGVEGIVYVQFIVNKDGSLSDVKVIKGIHTECDAEALKVIKNYPNGWNPGKQSHRPVRVRMMMPIRFTLNH